MTLKSGFSERKRRSFCINGSFTESVILKRRKPIKGYMFCRRPRFDIGRRPAKPGRMAGKGLCGKFFGIFCGLFTFVIENKFLLLKLKLY